MGSDGCVCVDVDELTWAKFMSRRLDAHTCIHVHISRDSDISWAPNVFVHVSSSQVNWSTLHELNIVVQGTSIEGHACSHNKESCHLNINYTCNKSSVGI